jgi:very-short-patch-repair endonuclease
MEKRNIHSITCKNCPTIFDIKVTPTNLEIGNHKIFCSLSCAQSFNKQGSKNPMFGKAAWSIGQTKETNNIIKKMSEDKSGANHHYYGKKLSEEHKEKIRKGLDTDEFRFKSKKTMKLKFKEKYGKDWETHYNSFLESMSKVNTLEWFVEKHGKVEGAKKYKERNDNLKLNSYFVTHPEDNKRDSYSQISQKLFWEIYNKIKDSYKEIYFAEFNHEHSCLTGPYRFDFVILDNKKIIEFNGNKFHPKPNLSKKELKKWTTPHGILGSVILERDVLKKEKAENNDFQILYVWENEYKKNKNKVIDKCLQFLSV